MAQLRLGYPAIKQRGAEVAQITATPPNVGALSTHRFTLPSVYLSDGDHAVHRHNGLTTRSMLNAMKGSLKSFPGMVAGVVQGQQPSPLPYVASGLADNAMEQAVFLIGRDGRVSFRHIADGRAHIPSNDTLLHALDALP